MAIADPSHPLESNVKSYVRTFPIVIKKAKGAIIIDESGNEYLDFLSGAGALNYGHNNDKIKQHLIDYLQGDGLIHGLDLSSTAKNYFIDTFEQLILKPRDMNYKLQFCGPTGASAVEAGLNLARKVTGRPGIISFNNSFHGITMGALAVTGNQYYREDIPGLYQYHTTFMPYDGYSHHIKNSIAYLRQCLQDKSSGVSIPAAVIVETVQGEGGINMASKQWLQDLRELCDEFGIVMIVDDIQMGCGRTGDFFSFEQAQIKPDIILLSKSIGAYGFPMALVLLKPELDQWAPGQNNGTFRGHNLAFVAAAKALEVYWSNEDFSREIKYKSSILKKGLQDIADHYPQAQFDIRGRGLAFGLESKTNEKLASLLQKECFARHLIIETCGSFDQVLKLLPPLTITQSQIKQCLSIIADACSEAI